MGVPVWYHCYVVSVGRRGRGAHLYTLYYSAVLQLLTAGEQLLLLARRGGGCDGVWEAEGETGPSQQSW